MAKITYTNKVTLNPQPSIANENKVTDSDMNEIKSSVNTLYDNQGDLSSLQTTTKTDLVSAINETITYSTTEQRVGTWINGKPLYRKVFDTGALPNATSKNIASGLTNVNVVNISGYAARSSDNLRIALPYAVKDFNVGVLYDGSNNIRIVAQADMTAYTESYVVIEYTKTTD